MGYGGEGEGERGEGEDGNRERSTMKPMSSAEPVGIINNNQPMMGMTVSRGMRTRQAIE